MCVTLSLKIEAIQNNRPVGILQTVKLLELMENGSLFKERRKEGEKERRGEE